MRWNSETDLTVFLSCFRFQMRKVFLNLWDSWVQLGRFHKQNNMIFAVMNRYLGHFCCFRRNQLFDLLLHFASHWFGVCALELQNCTGWGQLSATVFLSNFVSERFILDGQECTSEEKISRAKLRSIGVGLDCLSPKLTLIEDKASGFASIIYLLYLSKLQNAKIR